LEVQQITSFRMGHIWLLDAPNFWSSCDDLGYWANLGAPGMQLNGNSTAHNEEVLVLSFSNSGESEVVIL